MTAEHFESGRPLPIVIVGHVDHGKSTLIGRLLYETGSLPDGKVEQIRTDSEKRGMPFEWSFVMDALQVERDQGITVDSAQIWFSTERRRYVIIDAPGHKEFLKNMVTGAASAEAAVLVIDAEEGVSEQTRRHAFLLNLLGVSQVAVAINKMDLVGHGQTRFEEVSKSIRDFLGGLDIVPSAVVPVSARHGGNIATPGNHMSWYTGLNIVEALDAFTARATPLNQSLRFFVQDLYKFDERRLIAGRVECGRLKVGDILRFAPSSATARIASIETWNQDTPQISAIAGQSIAITLDDDIFVERGHVAAHSETPPREAHALSVRLFWLGRSSLAVGSKLKLKIGTSEYQVTVDAIHRVIDSQNLGHSEGTQVERNGFADIVLRCRAKIVFDRFSDNPATGRGVLVSDYQIVGGCILQDTADTGTDARNLTAVAHSVNRDERTQANGHEGAVIWLTGLSGSGKSTLAMGLEQQLFDRGHLVYVLDGDNLRAGLNGDLGFSLEDRAENIRRVAETAKLFADAGLVVITAFISPYRDDRRRAKDIVGHGFHEIFVKADMEICEARDPKGLYAKARAGEIATFTGVSDPYEEPAAPDIVIDTAERSAESCVTDLVRFVEAKVRRSGHNRAAS